MGHTIKGKEILTTLPEHTVKGKRRGRRKRLKLIDDVKRKILKIIKKRLGSRVV